MYKIFRALHVMCSSVVMQLPHLLISHNRISMIRRALYLIRMKVLPLSLISALLTHGIYNAIDMRLSLTSLIRGCDAVYHLLSSECHSCYTFKKLINS